MRLRTTLAVVVLLVSSVAVLGSTLPDDDAEDLQVVSSQDTTIPAEGSIVHEPGRVPVPDSAYPGEIPAFEQRYVRDRGTFEPTLAFDDEGRAFFQSIPVPEGEPQILRTADQGKSWMDVTPSFMGEELPPNPSDPYLTSDDQTGRVYNLNLAEAGPWVAWTDDGGDTWTHQPLSRDQLPGTDHPTLFTGPPTTLETAGYPSVVYLCVAGLPTSTQCAHSLTGGLEWTSGSPAFVGCVPQSGHGHASEVTGLAYVPKAHCNRPALAISSDNGMTWETILVNRTLGFSDQAPGLGLNHEARVATDAEGNVFYLWVDDDYQPRLSMSTDGGRSWGPAFDVGIPNLTAAKFPAIAAAGEGRVALTYVGSTVEGGFDAPAEVTDDARWHQFVTTSLNVLDNPVFATTTVNEPSDPIHIGDCRDRCTVPGPASFGQGIYDYLDLEINPETGRVWTTLVDTCNQACNENPEADDDQFRARGAVGVQVDGSRIGMDSTGTSGDTLSSPTPAREEVMGS